MAQQKSLSYGDGHKRKHSPCILHIPINGSEEQTKNEKLPCITVKCFVEFFVCHLRHRHTNDKRPTNCIPTPHAVTFMLQPMLFLTSSVKT